MFALLARSASLALSGIITGLYVRDTISYPGVKRLPAPYYARYHQEMDRDFSRTMPFVGNAAVLAGIATVATAGDRRSRALAGIALGCGLAEIALTLTKNVPLNKRVQSWSAEAPPADWGEVRDAWMAGHRLRTGLSLVGLGCQIAASVRR